MIVAELEVFHSRPIAPTRRVAIGQRNLPTDPAPGAGGLLLAGILAQTAPEVPSDLRESLFGLLEDLDAGFRVPQPRVRHRFQTDTVGLLRSTQRLIGVDGTLEFEFEGEKSPVPQALAALYAAAQLPVETRRVVFDAMRSALIWGREVDARFISMVMGGGLGKLSDLTAWNDPVSWALEILGLDEDPSKRAVQRKFRSLLRDAHPDHGAADDMAARRIAELTEARDILVA